MKNKLWIKSRVFLSFLIFTIFIVNIFAYLLYYLVSENIKNNIYKWISNEFQTIKTFIDIQSSNIFTLPKYEIEKINNLWYYFYIWNNDSHLKKNYKLWYYNTKNEIVFRWDYKWYNIIIWKTLNDFNNFISVYLEIIILLNILLIMWSIFLAYFITKFSLKPFLDLSNYLNKYNFESNYSLLKNKYWDSEIWKLTKAINSFIDKNNIILEKQTSFIQDVSHELKTPLMQINSNIELIENKIENSTIKNKINSIKESTLNINEIITNLSFILRWENNYREKELINMYSYFTNLIKKYEWLAGEKHIKIKINKINDLTLENNKYFLDRLFWNILSNAIFYNNWNNEILITISKNLIKIQDNWIWINKEDIKKIFSRFYRNENSPLYYKNWNWLWLSIVKKVCNIFWWKVKVESKKWKGSTFKILL